MLEPALAQSPWLQKLQQRFHDLLQQQRLPHALLLDGAPGWGQSELAAWLAHKLLNLPPSVMLDQVPELAHANLRWLEPDGANIGVDLIRTASHFTTTTAQGGGAKVLVINQAHFLNISAANALLKTLEEPVANTYLLLASGYGSRLLPTIRSRCQRFTLRGSASEAENWLAQHAPDFARQTGSKRAEAQASALTNLLFEFGGAPQLVAAGVAAGTEPLGPLLAKALGSSNPVAMASELLVLAGPETDPAELILRWLRYVVAEAAGAKRYAGLAGCSGRQLFGFADELLAVQRQLLASNSVNTKLQMERLLVRWRQLAG